MKIILQDGNAYLIRFERGEEVLSVLADACAPKNITGGKISAIGAVEEVVIAHYDLSTKSYMDKTIKERLEIVSLLGNVAMLDGKVIIHAHGSFSDSDMRVCGGHVKRLIVSATCELTLSVFQKPVLRAFDEETGLNLLK